MRLQAFAIGELSGNLAQRLCAGFADVDDRRTLLEVIHTERRREARGARRRQHMVRSGAVVAQRFGRVATEEHRARMADLVGPLGRFGCRDLEVLGGDQVRDGASLVHVTHLHHRATVGQRRADHVLARHVFDELVDAAAHAVEIGCVRADQDRLCEFVMLGLREQVHRDPVGIGRAIGQHENFRRAGDHVDADDAEHAALRGGDIRIARADDFIDLRDRRRAMRKRADGLRATDREHTVDAGDLRRCQHQRVLHTIRRRHDHDHFRDAGHLRRNGVHQHRRRVSGLAARDVDADPVERRDLLTQHRAVSLGEGKAVRAAFLLLPLVVDPYAVGRLLQRMATRVRQTGERRLQFCLRHLQRGHAAGIQAVEPVRVFEHGGVAARLHVSENGRGRAVDRLVFGGFEREHGHQLRIELGIGAVKLADLYGHGLTFHDGMPCRRHR